MALMGFREPNQVLWRGARPAHNGTQIFQIIDTSVNARIYLVPADVTFYLTDWHFGGIRNLDFTGQLAVRDPAPGSVTIAFLCFGGAFTGVMGTCDSQNLVYPIELSTGYEVYVFTTELCRGYIHGWVE